MTKSDAKIIWLPKGETKATARDGNVVTWDEMTFQPKPIKPPTGFGKSS